MIVIRIVSRVLGYVATGFMMFLMLITVVDVFLRYFFNSPLTGTTEISRLMMIIIVFPALGWAAIDRAHIRVDIFVTSLRARLQAIISSITLIITLCIFSIITWRSFMEAMVVNRQTSLIKLPFTPFYWIMSCGLVIFCLAVVALIVEDIGKVMKK